MQILGRNIGHKWRRGNNRAKAQDGESDILLDDYLSASTSILICAMITRSKPSGAKKSHLERYQQWFQDHIRRKYDSLPKPFLEIGAHTLDTNPTTLSMTDFEEILTVAVKDTNMSLDQFVATLREKGFISKDDAYTSREKQFGFICIGILTMLYDPSMKLADDEICLASSLRSFSIISSSATWALTEMRLSEADGPLCDILRKFSVNGGPIPQLDNPTHPIHQDPVLDTIEASNVNFHHLHRLGGIQIVWVDSLCEHLELNAREKRLKLFKCPSYCALLSWNDDGGTFLDSIFEEFFKDEYELPMKTAKKFMKELLETYRLLFGQDKQSWRLCKKMMNQESKGANAQIPFPDPLLERLCCQPYDYDHFYDEIGALEARSVYSACANFLFFGSRLIAMQEYTRLQAPTNLQTLWYDRRDINRFYTIWAAIVFSIMTLTLALIGIGLAIAQVALAAA